MTEISDEARTRLQSMAREAEKTSRIELPGTTEVLDEAPEGSIDITALDFIGETIRDDWDAFVDLSKTQTYFEELQRAVPDAFLVQYQDENGSYVAGFAKAMRPGAVETAPEPKGGLVRIKRALGFKGLEK